MTVARSSRSRGAFGSWPVSSDGRPGVTGSLGRASDHAGLSTSRPTADAADPASALEQCRSRRSADVWLTSSGRRAPTAACRRPVRRTPVWCGAWLCGLWTERSGLRSSLGRGPHTLIASARSTSCRVLTGTRPDPARVVRPRTVREGAVRRATATLRGPGRRRPSEAVVETTTTTARPPSEEDRSDVDLRSDEEKIAAAVAVGSQEHAGGSFEPRGRHAPRPPSTPRCSTSRPPSRAPIRRQRRATTTG